MDQEHINHLRAIFDECDHNQTGYINKSQLKELVTKITSTGLEDDDLDTLMKTLDDDNDGKIGFQEFINGYNMIDPELLLDDQEMYNGGGGGEGDLVASPEDYERYIHSIFNQFDRDNDGMVTIEQLREMLEDIKQKSGIEGDDADVNYIIQMLTRDGQEVISFQQFMSAIEHINSPSTESPPIQGVEGDLSEDLLNDIQKEEGEDSGKQDDVQTDGEEDRQQPPPLDDDQGVEEESPSKNSFREILGNRIKKGVKGRASSWVAPVSIVHMIKKRAEMFAKEEQIQVYTDASIEQGLFDHYRRKEAQLRSENEHLGSKIKMFDDQLREVRERHEKLSEDNAQLKQSVVIGKKTLIHNQKLVSTNKSLEEALEQVKVELRQVMEQRSEFQRVGNKLKTERDQLVGQLENANQLLANEKENLKRLEEQQARNAPLLKKAASFQQLPMADLDKLREENAQLRLDLEKEIAKSQDNIKLLTEECQLLKKVSKEDKALIDSSNQIIHKLRTTLEEKDSRSHNSDPNYKFSLLSELEHEVVTRMGTPGALPVIEQLQDQNEPTTDDNPNAIPISSNGKPRRAAKKIEDDEDLSSSSSSDDEHSRVSEWKEKFEQESLKAKEMEQLTLQLQSTIQENDKKHQQIESKLQQERDQLQESLNKLSELHSDLTSTMATTSQTLETTTDHVTTLQQSLDKINEKSQKLEEENKSLRNQLETSLPAPIDPITIKAEQTQNELSLLKQRVEELATKNTSLATENVNLKHLQQQQQSYSPITSPSNSTQDIPAIDVLGGGLITPSSQQNINELQGQVNTLNEVKEKLERDVKRYQSLAENSSQQLSKSALDSNTLIDELKKEMEVMKVNHQKLDEKNRIVEYQYQQATETNKELKEQALTLNERIEMIKLEYDTKLNQSNSHFEKKSKIIKENEELKQRLKKYESEDHHIDIIEMEDQAKTLRIKLDDALNRLHNEKQLNKHLQAQLGQAESQSINQDQTPLISNNNYANHNRRQCCGIC